MNFINKMNFIRTDVKNKLKNGKKNLKRIWNLWNFKIENHKEDFEYFYFFKWKYFFFYSNLMNNVKMNSIYINYKIKYNNKKNFSSYKRY